MCGANGIAPTSGSERWRRSLAFRISAVLVYNVALRILSAARVSLYLPSPCGNVFDDKSLRVEFR